MWHHDDNALRYGQSSDFIFLAADPLPSSRVRAGAFAIASTELATPPASRHRPCGTRPTSRQPLHHHSPSRALSRGCRRRCALSRPPLAGRSGPFAPLRPNRGPGREILITFWPLRSAPRWQTAAPRREENALWVTSLSFCDHPRGARKAPWRANPLRNHGDRAHLQRLPLICRPGRTMSTV